MAVPAYQISQNFKTSKVISGGTHRQAGDLISPLSFFESRVKIAFIVKGSSSIVYLSL
jgi:hypothetical protein